MKRIRIWIKNLTLIEQFISISFFVVIVFLLFFFTFIPKNIDNYINVQMYDYIHTVQDDYINRLSYSISIKDDEDSNVSHYLYSKANDTYISLIEPGSRAAHILANIDPYKASEVYDGSLVYDDITVIYSIRQITIGGSGYSVVSIVKDDYRSAMRSALVNSIVNVTMIIVLVIYTFLSIWVFSLIRPLNAIKNYIDKLRRGDKATLKLYRHDEIGEVGEAVVDMNEELMRQSKIREEMIQNISHDLKTPIATIKSYSESIKDGIYPYDTLEKSVDVIIDNADRLERKVYSLITFNKMGYLQDDIPDGDNVNMIEVIKEAIMAANVLRGEIKIETELDEVYFHGDRDSWLIVVENLLDNALRYAKSVVRITLDEKELTIFDDGELMDKDRIEKLFKPYEMGNKGKFGLGLSIVKRVTETYGYRAVGENMNDGVIFRVIKPKRRKKKEIKKSEASEG